MRVAAQNYVGYYIDGNPVPSSRIKWKDLTDKPYIWHVVGETDRESLIQEEE